MRFYSARRDGWNNPIASRELMVLYYKYDPESLKVLRECLPKDYAVIPDMHILIHPKRQEEIYITRVYPGGADSITYYPTARALQALRKAYKGRGGWKGRIDHAGWIAIERRGRVIPLNKCKSRGGHGGAGGS